MRPSFLQQVKQETLRRVNKLPSIPHPKANTLDFTLLFQQQSQPNIIAEIKLSSPSSGRLYHGYKKPFAIAQSYIHHGARALSILTEPDFFEGNLELIRHVRTDNSSVLILQKDFILSKKQIDYACHYGASAILLILGFISLSLFKELYDYAMSLGLTVICEVHQAEDIDLIAPLQPKVISINNRNLHSLSVTPHHAVNLIDLLPRECIKLCASGVTSGHRLKFYEDAGFDGFLIGSAFMQHPDPGLAYQQLMENYHES